MKAIVRRIGFSLILLSVGLLAGCATYETRVVQRVEPANDFEVVETSVGRPLTSSEMSEMRRTVTRYLETQGATDTGDYYLKIYLTPEAEGTIPEWVVVRFTRYTDTRVAVVDDYPLYSTSPYYSWDYYPYGYGSFSRVSFQYYDDPFHRRSYYIPRNRNWRRDHDNRPGSGHHDGRPHDGPSRPGGGHAWNRPTTPPPANPGTPGVRPGGPSRPPNRWADRVPPSRTTPRTGSDTAVGNNSDNNRPPRPDFRGNRGSDQSGPRQWRQRNENGGQSSPQTPRPQRVDRPSRTQEARNTPNFRPSPSPAPSPQPARIAPTPSSSPSRGDSGGGGDKGSSWRGRAAQP